VFDKGVGIESLCTSVIGLDIMVIQTLKVRTLDIRTLLYRCKPEI